MHLECVLRMSLESGYRPWQMQMTMLTSAQLMHSIAICCELPRAVAVKIMQLLDNNAVLTTVQVAVVALYLSHELEREHDICIALSDSQDVDIIMSHIHEAAGAQHPDWA